MFRNLSISSLVSKLRAGFVLLLFTAACLGGGVARAQLSGKGEIKGTVKDPTGAVIPNATVTATAVATGTSTTRPSNGSGDFDISPLDAGVYSVTVVANGFEKLTQDNVQVNTLEITDYNPVLTVGSSTETVTVSAAPPALSDAVLGATMENDMYSALPIEMGAYGSPDQRRATDFAFLMPGVQGNNTSGNATTNTGIVNGSGSKGAVSDVYVDGVAFVRAGGNGDPRYVWTAISVDAVDQFQVQTSGYSAIYEGQGIQNYTIKQGGKSTTARSMSFPQHGAGYVGLLRPGDAESADRLPQKPIENSNEYGINLSGPLLPFAAVEGQAVLLRQLQRLPLCQPESAVDHLPHNCPAKGGLQCSRAAADLRPVFADRLHFPQHQWSLPVSVRLRV
jgi:hypothetical protein